MVGDQLSHAVANFRIIDEVKKLLENASASMDSDPGRAYEKLKDWKEKRIVVSPGGAYKGSKIQGVSSLPCESPGVRAIQSLYTSPIRRGVVNVLYDEPGTGKSMAGMAVLNDFYRFPNGEEIKGIMVSPRGSTERQLYVEAAQEILDMSNIKGWLYLLLWILDEPRRAKPSLLILDDFILDTGERGNLAFIAEIYKCLNPPDAPTMNVVVVVMTQYKDAADALCALNGGKRVRPIEGFYETATNPLFELPVLKPLANRTLTHPTWKRGKWTRKLLLRMIEYHFTRLELEEIKDFDFIAEDMTPYDAKVAVEAKLDTEAQRLTSPSQQYRSGGEFSRARIKWSPPIVV